MLDPQVWREAATQVFFALGLGFGGVIAFSSYNKQDNNCHFDATLVSFINFFTSVLATLVVFAVLGFKANIMNEKCVVENAEKILGYLNTNVLSHDLIPPHVNFSHLTAKDYNEMYRVIMTVKEGHFKELGLDACLLEDELNKSVQGTGLAFIAFTEAMTHFPASPFWSVMFFLMLINLGLGSMIGTMSGITTPIIDTFKVRKEVFTVGCCIFAFVVGLIFVQRSGNYFVTMFDDYSATLPLTVVVILENIAVAWIYGTKKGMCPQPLWGPLSPLSILCSVSCWSLPTSGVVPDVQDLVPGSGCCAGSGEEATVTQRALPMPSGPTQGFPG
uniref:Uncharacterized protein n=1 Tax=Zonotrichia albicollis TaxID=44394 RepID=A0A8D2MHX6_ZONAL